MIVAPAICGVGPYALSIRPATRVHHPNRVMMTIPATSTFGTGKRPELERA